MAATSAARTSPLAPAGSKSNTSTGNTMSAFDRFGYKTRAMVPGRIMKKRTGSFRNPAKREPHRPWFMVLAPRVRCTISWLEVQK